MAIALASAVLGAAQAKVQVTSVYSVDYHGQAGVPEVGDPWFGAAGNFTITGHPNAPFTIAITCGASTYKWSNLTLGTGNFWWWGSFDSSLDGPIPVTVTVSTTGSSSTASATLAENVPAHAIEFIDARPLNATVGMVALFKQNSGVITKLENVYGQPQLTSSQGPTISYTPPASSSQVITQPLGTPIQQVKWTNMNSSSTTQVSSQESFSSTVRNSRVNSTIMRTIPWSAVQLPLPASVAQWQWSEFFCPTTAPEVISLVNGALPSNYLTTMTPWDAARAVFSAVVKRLSYNATFSAGPLAAYDQKMGQCSDFSFLFVAGLRRLGFAAHVCAGWNMGVNGTHVWAEFYMPGVGWVPADPTYSQSFDPTGASLYDFGTMTILNGRICDSLGGNCTWPDPGVNIPFLQVPWWWYWGTVVSTGSDWSTDLTTTTPVSVYVASAHLPSNGRLFGRVELQSPAGANGMNVQLSSSSNAVSVPPTLPIGGGSSAQAFPISIGSVKIDTAVTITVSSGSTHSSTTFTVHPATVTTALGAKWYAGVTNPQVTFTLSAPITIASTVNLVTNVPGWAIPASVTIPAGATSATVGAPLPVSASATPITVTSTVGTYSDTDTALAAPRPIGIFASSLALGSGAKATLTVQLATAAPAGGLIVTLSSSSTALKLAATSVTIAAGKTSGTTTVTAGTVTTPTVGTVTAMSSLGSASEDLTVL